MTEGIKVAEKATLDALISRGLRLRCPRCGEGKLFIGLFKMHEHCPACNLKYERDPGYFLGSAYINYALTAMILTPSYFTLHFGFDLENRILFVPLAAFCILFPLFFFRYARGLWMAFDSFFDRHEEE